MICLMDDRPNHPVFTPQMRSTHKLLVPQMAPLHFNIIIDLFRQAGYDAELLCNSGPNVVHEGLMYVHNDACYPSMLVIGQFIDALKSGKYDAEKVALVITQTGGGCRASNYIHLLRKALVKTGFYNVPVVSLNASNLERDSGLRLTLNILLRAVAACFYGDELMALKNQVQPYEDNIGESERLTARWQKEISKRLDANKGITKRGMRRICDEMARDFAKIKVTMKPTYKVGIVGEIYVKFSPVGNNNLEKFLLKEGCEVNVPGLMGFIQYCIENAVQDKRLYGGSRIAQKTLEKILNFIISREKIVANAMVNNGFRAPCDFEKTRELAQNFISLGTKMGEGWLLTGEMADLIEHGFSSIVCAQPFGCLPNHVAGRGMIAKIQRAYPEANITSIDYDPSATQVNQENRIKLMLSSTRKTMPAR